MKIGEAKNRLYFTQGKHREDDVEERYTKNDWCRGIIGGVGRTRCTTRPHTACGTTRIAVHQQMLSHGSGVAHLNTIVRSGDLTDATGCTARS